MSRTWNDGTSPFLSAANLNAMEADITSALGVPDGALASRINDAGSSARAALNATYAPVSGSSSYAPIGRSFPPPPMTPNPSQIASVTVAADSETLPHPSTAGTSLHFDSIAEPARYNYFGGGGKFFTYVWNGNNVIRAGTTKGDIAYGPFVTRYITNSSWIMHRSQLSAPGSFEGNVQIRVNGQVIWQKNQVFSGTYAGVFGGIDITFNDNSWKTVEIFSSGWAYSVNYETGKTLNPWQPPAQKKLYILGDSYTAGTSQAGPIGSYARYLQTLAPWDVSYNGQGGTGYVNNGQNTAYSCKFGDARRVAAITEYAPDVLVVLGSINDNGLAGIQAAATQLYADVKAGSPNTTIIAVGPQLNDSSNPATSTALAAAAAASSNVIGYVEPTAAGWDVAGVRGPSDMTHPSAIGAEWYAAQVLGTVRSLTVKAGDTSW